MDLMKWKSPRRARRRAPAGRPSSARYPRARHRADREAVLEILRAVQIPEPERALRRLPHEFSGGQRQRLMIAMALLPQPDLIIADEPTTALDVTIQAQILRLLRALVKERGVSVLFTTHDLGTAHEICDRVVVMYAGQEMEAAPTDAFFGRPAHPYTRRLLASLPSPDGEIRDIPGEVPSLVDAAAGVPLPPALRLRDRGVPRGAPGRRARSPTATACAAITRSTPPPEPARERARRRRCWSWSTSRATSRCATPSAAASAGCGPSTASRSQVRPGETLGLVGESGCGKSTLGKTVMGIHAPTAGEIRFAGREIGRLPPPRAARGAPRTCSTSTRTRAPRSTRAGRSGPRCTSRCRSTPRCPGPSATREVRAILRRGRPARRPPRPLPARALRRPAAPRGARAHPHPAARAWSSWTSRPPGSTSRSRRAC